jgi:predicted kinase
MGIEGVISAKGLTLHQWLVREAIRCKAECDVLWDSLDALQPKEEFDATLAEYNAICDWIDELETNAVQLFYNSLTTG